MAEAAYFDVVVVGSGAAGAVAPARLAESKPRSVLLLEAGPDLRGDTPPVLRTMMVAERLSEQLDALI